MSRATVSRLVDELVHGGVLTEQRRTSTGERGRPAVPLVPAAGRFAALGLQVNPSHLTTRVLDLSGSVVAERTVTGDFLDSDPVKVLRRLGSTAAKLMDGLPKRIRVVGAGLAVPGIVTEESGTLLRAPNLAWTEVDARTYLADALGAVPITTGNEADHAAVRFARARPGSLGSARDFLFISGEFGIGGSIVRDGAVLRGSRGWAGEIGHVCVDPNGPPCGCGANGCLEAFAGRLALLAGAGLPPNASASEIAVRAKAGDRKARSTVDAAAEAIGVAASSAVNLLDVPTVVLGGDLAVLGPLLRARVEAVVARRVLARTPEILFSAADPSTSATGAAITELERLVANPAAYLG